MRVIACWRAAIGLSVVLALPGAACSCQRQALEIPVQIVNHRPIVTISIEGVDLPMLLDTGAFHSMLMPSVAARLRLPLSPLPRDLELQGYTGRIEAQRTKVKALSFQGLPLQNIEFIVGGNELGSGIMGIVGRNLVGGTDVEYDLGQGLMRLMFSKGDCSGVHPVYWAEDVPLIEAALEGGRDSRALHLTTRINGRRTSALLDTGAPMSSLGLRAALRAGVSRSSLQAVGRTGGAGSGSAPVWLAPISSFELGGQKVENLQIQVAEVAARAQDMLLGLDYFLSHRIYVSRERQTLYATWNGGPIFARGALGGAAAAPATPAPLDDAEALARLAAATATRGDSVQALAHFDRVIELAPEHAEHRLARARLLLSQKHWPQASLDLEQALRLQPGLDAARLLLARLRLEQGLRAEGLADLQRLDQSLAVDAHERYEMATLYAALGMLPEASRQWVSWMAGRPHDRRVAEALSARCWLRARLGLELAEALKDCEAAIERDGRHPVYRDSLGWALLRRGEAGSALKAFDRAIELDGRLARSHYGRGLARRSLGDEAAAAVDLTAARQLRPRIDAEIAKAGFGAMAEGGVAEKSPGG